MKPYNKILYNLILSILVTGQLLIIYVVFMILYPFEVVKLNEFKVTTPVVKKGDFVCYNLNFTKKMSLKSEGIDWYIVNGTRHNLNTGGAYRPVGVTDSQNCKYIPDTPDIIPGIYNIQVDLAYKVFELRPAIIYSWTSNKFKVE